MNRYAVDIAPGYGHPSSASLTDGKHGCVVTATDYAEAKAEVLRRAKAEGWPTGRASIQMLNRLGQRDYGVTGCGGEIVDLP